MDGEFLSILGTMVILFFDISIGYIAKKAHVMDKAMSWTRPSTKACQNSS